ncbi:hypothetical protein [Myxococcus sp. NMCA1]|uniref:hypothetical protein n=1 Tax=Myxococcus sp. NMCA1 TaxID=2996785 RepID=UPI002285F51A|nr:hypothetical protein [Myxococcus sp. NMCA1]WAM24354.1 hypothetical protein OZ403_27935 [Myxococcus sp. NMCA1]
MSHSSDASNPTPALRINPGFVLGQLARALTLSAESPDLEIRARSTAKVAHWRKVLEGILTGALDVGSRTPVADAPAWATLKVVTGGFATGELLAEGPLSPHEQAWLKELGPSASHSPRAALNAYFLSDEGLTLLGELLATGAYRVDVPEEGALLVAAWLLRHGAAEQARTMIEELAPFFSRLRFYPVPHTPSTEDGLHVHLQSVAETTKQLQRVRLPLDIERERESAEVWTPLYDELVKLFLETRTSEGVCRHFPATWSERGSKLLDTVARARTKHLLCKWPHHSKSHFSKLCDVLAQSVTEPAALTPGQQRRVQHVLDDIARARGLPGSDRLQALRTEQQRAAARPTHPDLARVLVARLGAYSSGEGLDDLEQVTAPVTAVEAARQGVAAGAEFPPSLIRKLVRCANASIEDLIARKVVTSSEVLARVLPQVSAHVAAQGVNDPELRRLYGHIYAAFRRRRSLLLLDLQSQVKLQELPWVRAIDAHRTPDLGQQEVAAQTLERISSLAISAFPAVLIPNKLLQELRALAQAAGLKIPLVEELAADIFMNAFSPKFDEAARRAAAFVQGSLYARYYDIPMEPSLGPDAAHQEPSRRQRVSDFAQRCLARAQAEGHQPRGVSGNGMVIEQAQILTTHNLAVLFDALGLTRTLRPQLPELARRCFESVCQLLLRKAPHYQHRLRNVKNAAYAWRQMVFFLSLLSPSEQEDFGHWAQQRLAAQPRRIAEPFAPVLTRLLAVIEEQAWPLPGRVFFGWAVGSHWLLGAPRPERGSV